jgi:hypothetical protein
LIAQAEQAAWQQAQFWMQNNLFNLPNASANHSTKYPLIWPLQKGVITLQFGPCSQPFEPPGFGYPHFHTGIDIAYNQGSPIEAADDGVVVAASSSVFNGQLVGYGNYVIIAHRNNFFSLYGHLLGYVVKAGDTVHQGQLLGYEGSTGNSTGPHVHFEYRYGGQPTNPLPYLPAIEACQPPLQIRLPLRIRYSRQRQQAKGVSHNPPCRRQVFRLMFEQFGELDGRRIWKDLRLPAFLQDSPSLSPRALPPQQPGEPNPNRASHQNRAL